MGKWLHVGFSWNDLAPPFQSIIPLAWMTINSNDSTQCIYFMRICRSSWSWERSTLRHSSPGRMGATGTSGTSAKQNSYPPLLLYLPLMQCVTPLGSTKRDSLALCMEGCQVQAPLLPTLRLQTGFRFDCPFLTALAWKCFMFSAVLTYSKFSTALLPLSRSLWLTKGRSSGGCPKNDKATKRCTKCGR